MNGYSLFIVTGGAFHIFNGWTDGRCLVVGGASSPKGTYVFVGGFAWLCVVACYCGEQPTPVSSCVVGRLVWVPIHLTHPLPPRYTGCDSTHHIHPLGGVSTHMVQGGHHPNAWTRGGDWLVLLSLAVVAMAGGSMMYRIGNSSPIPPHGSPGSIYGLGPRIQQLIGQPPQCWVGVGIVAGRCCYSHRGWATGWLVATHV